MRATGDAYASVPIVETTRPMVGTEGTIAEAMRLHSPSSKEAAVRRVRLVSAGHTALVVQAGGTVVPTVEWGDFGDELMLSPQEEARLDMLGALAPEGA